MNATQKKKEYRRRIITTGKGFDWYGACERCGKYCHEHYKTQIQPANTIFPQNWTNGAYGHKSCLERDYPEFA